MISISPVLERVIKERERECVKAPIQLPDIDPATFADVISYAYHKQCAVQQDAHVAKPVLSMGMLVQLLIDNEWKHFGCLKCGVQTKLADSTTFPSCLNCAMNFRVAIGVNVICSKLDCTKTAKWLGGIICESCALSLHLLSKKTDPQLTTHGYNKLQVHIQDNFDTTETFRYDIPILAKELMEAAIREVCAVPTGFSSLLRQARTYVFAEKYGIEPLRRATLFTLFNHLAQPCGKKQDAAEIVELASYVYANTKGSGCDPEWTAKSILRRLVVEFLVYHGDTYQSSANMASLLHSGGELAADVFVAMTRLTRRLMKS